MVDGATYEVRAACALPAGLLLREPRAWMPAVHRLLYDGFPAEAATSATSVMDTYALCLAPPEGDECDARMAVLRACGLCDDDGACRTLHLTAAVVRPSCVVHHRTSLIASCIIVHASCMVRPSCRRRRRWTACWWCWRCAWRPSSRARCCGRRRRRCGAQVRSAYWNPN